MNAKITQGKRQLWQWDTGVQLMLFDIGTANEVHFATPDGVIRRDIVNNMCNIPDVVLQRAGTMVCYVFNREPYEGDTRHEFHFDVLPRPKPADYIDPPDEADYIDLIAERAAKALPLFIVHVERVDGVLRADKTPAEISEALNARRVCMLRYGDAVLSFYGWRDGNPAFAGVPFKAFSTAHGAHYVHDLVVLDDGTVDATISEVNGLTAYPLVFEGGVEASYNGSKETRINISNVVNNALTVAKESGDFNGEPGTSVTINSITQSTEDDGYSVVTFSDGKQLRVKNGSKGSAGEGGVGGGSSKYTQPEWGAENGVIVLPETTVSGEDMLPIVQKFDLEIGQEYVVHWNGTEYATACFEVQGMAAIGNIGAATGTGNTGEPFVILRVPDDQVGDDGAYGAAMALDGSTSATLSITGNMMHKIPAEYVEENYPPLIVTVIGDTTGNSLHVDTDFETIAAAIDAGRAVYLSHNGAVYPASGKRDLYINFSSTPDAHNPSIGVYEFELYTLDSNGILTRSGLLVANNDMLGELRVFLKDDGTGNYTADYSSAVINSRYRNGAPVTCYLLGGTQQAPIKVWKLVSTGETDKAVFSRTYISDGSVVISTVTIEGVNATVEERTVPPTDDLVSNVIAKLPNPQPLTINGTSYDGSEAVNIDIAAGGGGASDDVYELIETYTTTESVAFERTQEPDGTKYNFKALLVKFDIASGASGYISLNANYGNTGLGKCTITPISNSRCYAMFEVTQEKGYWRDMACDAITVQDRFLTPIFHGWGDLTSESVQRYPYISKLISTGSIPAGVKMEIWGVRT